MWKLSYWVWLITLPKESLALQCCNICNLAVRVSCRWFRRKDTLRKELLLALLSVYWKVTPQMDQSFQRDCEHALPATKLGYEAISGLVGVQRAASESKEI